jgi:hypothetical protein
MRWALSCKVARIRCSDKLVSVIVEMAVVVIDRNAKTNMSCVRSGKSRMRVPSFIASSPPATRVERSASRFDEHVHSWESSGPGLTSLSDAIDRQPSKSSRKR